MDGAAVEQIEMDGRRQHFVQALVLAWVSHRRRERRKRKTHHKSINSTSVDFNSCSSRA